MLNRTTILKYTIIHAVEFALVVGAVIIVRHYVRIPTWLVVLFLVLWVVKDVVIYLKVWRSYAYGDNRPTNTMIGLEATAVSSIDPAGYVRTRGEIWKAEINEPQHPAAKGERTRVVDIKGMTLVVERGDEG